MRTPALLAILDGFGIAPDGPGNAVTHADSPFLDDLFENRPTIEIAASGPDVGLPQGQMGNSEVGHLNMGSGRVVPQELLRINGAVEDGSIFENATLIDAIDAACSAGGAVHCMGLLSDGGVHSEMSHLEAIMELAARNGAEDICVHAFLDGRDVPPTSALGYIESLERFMDSLNARYGCNARISSIAGRSYSMDRDKRMEKVALGWGALVRAEGNHASTATRFVQDAYASGLTDEFVVPGVVDGAHPGIHDGDCVIFFNFRPDRAREMTYAFVLDDFDGFDRGRVPRVHYVCMTDYDEKLDVPVAFPKVFPQFVLADYLSSLGLTQLHIAETEKYAHVTFFFNGGVEEPKEGEKRILIASPRDVATYDLKPQMSAPEVTDALVEAIEDDAADVYIVNYANCDMVGHTGVFDAAVKAVEAVDAGLSRVVGAIADKGGVAIVTADHGNAEKMLDDDGVTPFTAHTLSKVPLCIALGDASLQPVGDGRLADVAPTLIDLMGLKVPQTWSGRSLLA